MPDPTYDQVSASTIADLQSDVVYDEFFVETTMQRKLRASGVLDEYLGGTDMRTPFIYGRVHGGAHTPGGDVTIVQNQILAATSFQPKEYIEIVPLNLWEVNVINAGPNAKVRLADLFMSNAVQALNTDLGIDWYRHGQASSSTVSDNRAIYINGASEALNDGVNPSWDGNVFTTYGGQTRNGVVGNVLNSVPRYAGINAATGQMSYSRILEPYLDCVKEPDIITSNKAAWAYMAERQEPKQGFVMESDLSVGVKGLRVMNAYWHIDKLCPSTKYGSILPSGLSNTTSVSPANFTAPATVTSLSGMTNAWTIVPGEILFMFRVAGWKIRPVADEEFAFNFTPPIRTQQNPDLVVMFLKAGINFYTPSPRDNVHVFGFGF